MKTIIYGFFIYVFLATISGFTLTRREPPGKNGLKHIESKCSLTEIINTSGYVDDCKEYASIRDIEKTLPAFGLNNIAIYLCAGIFETADRICELNVTPLPTNIAMFNNTVEKSQLVSKDLTKVCSAISGSILNSTYISIINYTAHPKIVELNKNLVSRCEKMCWSTTSAASANSLCSVLLWEMEIIVNLRQQSPSPVDKHQSKKPQVQNNSTNKLHQELNHDNQNLDVLHSVKNELDNSQAKQLNSTANTNKPMMKLPKESLSTDNESKHEPETAKEHINLGPSLNANTLVVGNSNAGSKLDVTSPVDTPQGSGVESQIQQEPLKENEIIGQVEKVPSRVDEVAVKAKEETGGDKKPEPDDIEGNLDDDGDGDGPGVPENGDLPQKADKNIDLNLPNQVPASSSHDNQEKSGGQEQAATIRESIASRGHSLAHTEPLDPPQHFFAYFMAVSFICLLCYVGYHKKHKIMAIIFEGRKSRGGRGRRRPNTAGYRKLDCNLEEAVTSQCNSNVTHVIY